MYEETPHIDVRAVQVTDALALLELDARFETDCIYTLRVQNRLLQTSSEDAREALFCFELVEIPVDPPLYRDTDVRNVEEIAAQLQRVEGGYVALADEKIAGVILLRVDSERQVTCIEEITVGHQFRRYGVGSLLLHCASDWARERDCWAITLETQSTNYPAVQFYLRNGLDIWSISRNYYPPSPTAHEIAIVMGKRLSSTSL